MDLKALHKVSYGIYIVTSRRGDQINGQIANTVFQVTAEPPTLAVSINKDNLTWQFIKESKVFAVAVMCQSTPLTFIGRFGFKSGRDINKFEGVKYKTGVTGAPIVLENTVSYLEVEVTRELDVGTHTIFVGNVVNAEIISDEACMTYEYYHQIKGGKTPKAAATYIEEKSVKMEKQPGPVKYRCTVCGYIYDPEMGDPEGGGIAPGTPFEKIPDHWVCPACGASKTEFEKVI